MKQSGQDWHGVDDNEGGQLGQMGQQEATCGSIALRPRGANSFTLNLIPQRGKLVGFRKSFLKHTP